jgi:hypothetical protein
MGKMAATFNLTRTKVKNMSTYNVSRAMIHINDVKYDLLKIAEMYDGLLQDGLGYMAADMFCKYLEDMREGRWIHSFEISDIVLKEQSYTYDVNVQITGDRTPKKLKIHVGLYKSPWPDLAPSLNYNKETGYNAQ